MKQFSSMLMMEIKTKEISNSSLIIFRVLWGLLLLFSTIRFINKGWINDFYVKPQFHFTYYGFDWLRTLSPDGMYSLFYLFVVLAFFITIGLFYRLSIIIFFLGFTYVELIDKTYYLNHYYALSLITFIMIFLPLNQRLSVDTFLFNKPSQNTTSNSYLNILRFQIGLLYFFAGVAKLNYDWMFRAQPLKIWLHAQPNLPLIGNLLEQNWIAYLMSWTGAIYDLSITFLLLAKKTRMFGFILVIIFHLLTGLMFHIGVFPWIMIILAILFFEPDTFESIIIKLENLFKSKVRIKSEKEFVKSLFKTKNHSKNLKNISSKIFQLSIIIYFLIQIIMPVRHYFYKGNFFWTEQGFRFAWHVMIIEKTGMIYLNIMDKDTGKKWTIEPKEYLTDLQAKMMSTQPDMIIQFAHYLADIYRQKGYKNIEIKADSYVALNGRTGKRYVNPEIDLLDYQQVSDVNNLLMPFE